MRQDPIADPKTRRILSLDCGVHRIAAEEDGKLAAGCAHYVNSLKAQTDCLPCYVRLRELDFNGDAEIQAALAELQARGATAGERVTYSPDTARHIRDESFDLDALRARGYAYERLDQLTLELLLGVR